MMGFNQELPFIRRGVLATVQQFQLRQSTQRFSICRILERIGLSEHLESFRRLSGRESELLNELHEVATKIITNCEQLFRATLAHCIAMITTREEHLRIEEASRMEASIIDPILQQIDEAVVLLKLGENRTVMEQIQRIKAYLTDTESSPIKLANLSLKILEYGQFSQNKYAPLMLSMAQINAATAETQKAFEELMKTVSPDRGQQELAIDRAKLERFLSLHSQQVSVCESLFSELQRSIIEEPEHEHSSSPSPSAH